MTFARPPQSTSVLFAPLGGQSEAAARVQGQLQIYLDAWIRTASLGAALSALQRLTLEAAHAGWLAEGCPSLNSAAYDYARKFLAALLPTTSQPDVSVDPSGDVAFEWDFGPGRWLVASIDSDGLISFASANRTSRLRGQVHFAGSLPEPLRNRFAELQND